MKCNGCGVEIQTLNPSLPGYIPEDVLKKRLKEGKEILCRRCFRMKYYGEYEDLNLKDFLKEYEKIIDEFENILLIVDIFDVEGTLRYEMMERLKGKKIILVLNKMDLIPKYVRKHEMMDWILRKYDGEVFLVSAQRKHGIDSLKRRLVIGGKEYLVIGCSNVGKSSVIRCLTESEITISPFPGTTLGLIKRRMRDSNVFLYDTPGLITNDRFIDMLKPSCQKRIIPKDEVRRKTFKSKIGRIYFLGGLVIMEPMNDGILFKLFAASEVRMHETSKRNLERLIKKSWGKFLVPPCSPKQLKYEEIDWEEVVVEVDQEKDLNFTGLGWLNVKKGKLKLKIRKPKNAKMMLREALINPKRKR